jgi:hypothetical protein
MGRTPTLVSDEASILLKNPSETLIPAQFRSEIDYSAYLYP